MDVKEQLNRVHALELKIALEIKRICEKHNISYFLTAGTLLGAVRHGGFIPWDDDMDIGMLRQDYQRFLEACKTDLGSAFFLQTWDTDPYYPFSYAKVRLNGTHFVEEFSENSKMHGGIFVDVFPYDNVPDDPGEQKVQAKKYFVCKRLLWIKKGLGRSMRSDSFRQLVRYSAFWLFSRPFKYEGVKSYFQQIQTKYNQQRTEKIVTDGSYPYSREAVLRQWAENLAPVSFEGHSFLAFKDKEVYLTHLYGDYMQLPPEEERNRHKRLQVDFGAYGN